jgi:hypothetical protein
MRVLALLLMAVALAAATSRVDSIPVDSLAFQDGFGGGTADSTSLALPNDGWTSYVSSGAYEGTLRFALGTNSIPEGYDVDSIVVVVSITTGNIGVLIPGLYLSATSYWGDSLPASAVDFATERSAVSVPGVEVSDLSTIRAIFYNTGEGSMYLSTGYVIVYSTDGGEPEPSVSIDLPWFD